VAAKLKAKAYVEVSAMTQEGLKVLFDEMVGRYAK
jgi:hypothetical protein